ncbi:Hypothetical protein ERS027644_04130 [Mycobacterium tuberculosis]|nr:Hypothetical protein ERS027644_04130 [Mycobacterium tuberculosis]CKT45974.1 Hypothetical protein ERS027656_04426 [Mycobacterium tuberculosis]
MIDGTEFDGGQLVRLVRLGKASDIRLPVRGRHGDAKVIEYGTATDDRLPAGMVGGRHRSVAVDEQVHSSVLGAAFGHPTPGLAVVHRRRPACQQDCVLEHLYVHNVDGMVIRFDQIGSLVLSMKSLASLSFQRCLRENSSLVAALDRLDAAVDELSALSFDALTTPERDRARRDRDHHPWSRSRSQLSPRMAHGAVHQCQWPKAVWAVIDNP